MQNFEVLDYLIKNNKKQNGGDETSDLTIKPLSELIEGFYTTDYLPSPTGLYEDYVNYEFFIDNNITELLPDNVVKVVESSAGSHLGIKGKEPLLIKHLDYDNNRVSIKNYKNNEYTIDYNDPYSGTDPIIGRVFICNKLNINFDIYPNTLRQLSTMYPMNVIEIKNY